MNINYISSRRTIFLNVLIDPLLYSTQKVCSKNVCCERKSLVPEIFITPVVLFYKLLSKDMHETIFYTSIGITISFIS